MRWRRVFPRGQRWYTLFSVGVGEKWRSTLVKRKDEQTLVSWLSALSPCSLPLAYKLNLSCEALLIGTPPTLFRRTNEFNQSCLQGHGPLSSGYTTEENVSSTSTLAN